MQNCTKLVNDAIRLAHEMRLTTTTYSWGTFNAGATESQLFYSGELGKYKLVDAKTGQKLKRSSVKDLASDTVIGDKVCTIFPALERKGSNRGKLALVEETMLVSIRERYRQKPKRKAVVDTIAKG
ncbi:uncharacterized protein HMPREF1541_01292 [Cyphellophora europaea CBS 101466]|uniref:Uncharacterized protein n=1 Tax=Cyphellophora europaea (strain CBS 101466) TaxID=1220924 RepID=W2SEI3_CYPE1|nr:uncharacterized protein HMPREF1541_01292 [Cyphellophora europaea CBS 101466]ETN47102.1 hypothetical protein HMPREF1541_01292 [Cyphellophora europaea CBS 101466]